MKKQKTSFAVKLRIIGVLASVLIVTMTCLKMVYEAAKKNECTEKIQATVTSFITSSTSKQDEQGDYYNVATYAPVFEYTYDGKFYLASSERYKEVPAYEIGSKADIYIDPNDPDRIYEPDDNSLVAETIIMFTVAVIIFILFFFALPEVFSTKKKYQSFYEKKTYESDNEKSYRQED